MSKKENTIKIAIAGAGRGGSALLELFYNSDDIEVVGMADQNSKASGLDLADRLGIFTSSDISDLKGRKPDVVINVTGEQKTADFIRKSFRPKVEVLEGSGALMLWQLVSNQKKARNDMEVLHEKSLLINRSSNLKEALQEVIKGAMGLLETPAGVISLFDKEDIYLASQIGLSESFIEGSGGRPRKAGLTAHILKSDGPLTVQDTEREAFLKENIFFKEGFKSLLATPLRVDNNNVGILYLCDFSARIFTERDINILGLFSTVAANAIERFQLIDERERSLSYLQGVLDDSQDMIVATDSEGAIVKYSKGGERILGFRKDEMTGKKIADLYADRDARGRILEELKKKGAVYNYETTMLNKDGSNVDISLTLSELRNKDGQFIGTVGVSKNITIEKTLRRELEKKNHQLEKLNEDLEERIFKRTKELELSNRELKKANELKSRFIANASHELRTPLNSIIGFSEILQDKAFGDLNEKQEKYVGNVNTSGKHLLHLVNNILDLAKIEAGKAELNIEAFSIANIIDEVQTVLKALSDRKGIRLENNIPPDTTIRADRIKIKQVFYNLLSNAIKFTPEGGKVGVRIDEIRRGETEDWRINGHEYIKFSVWDTGIGIKDHDIDRIFDEFEQVDTSKATEGTGLGLSLTKKLIELHAGHIDIKSTYGEGSTFSIYLPLLTQEEMRSDSDIPVSYPIPIEYPLPEQKESPLVLVAEDDLGTSEVLTIHLTQAGYRVAHAYDGVEALEKAKEERPFAIALDIMLPKKDGWEVLQTLKSDPETAQIPVIIHSMIENKELAFALGATDYLVKPASRVSLIDKLKSLAPREKSGFDPMTILAVTNDPEIKSSLNDMSDRENLRLHFVENSQEGLELALSVRPNIIIIDTSIADGGFEVINRYKSNPLLEGIPVFALTSEDLSEDDKRELTLQIEGVLKKDALQSEELLTHLDGLKIVYPHKAGLVDELTGLFNNRYFDIRYPQEVSRTERYKFPMGLALLHIDHYVNYKVQSGDYYANLAVKKIASLLKKKLRNSDVLVRYKDDLFAIILTNTPIHSGKTLAKRLVERIHDYPFLHEELQPMGKLTASVGIAEFRGQSSGDLMKSADSALKKAIERGGNQVEFGN